MKAQRKNRPGAVRDAILLAFEEAPQGLTTQEVSDSVQGRLGEVPPSSVRSYLRLNTPGMFEREARGRYRLSAEPGMTQPELLPSSEVAATWQYGRTALHRADCFAWIRELADCSIHAVVTDPPYGLHEYKPEQQAKLRSGRGGVWRVPPSFDGCVRSPLPRFTTLTAQQLRELHEFFVAWGRVVLPKLVPGANVAMASNPLLSYLASDALVKAGLERRGELIRLVMTMRGGDRPKDAHDEFPGVSVMPRSMWEPWLLFRRPLEGRVKDNLRKWQTGGYRRPSAERPFGDVIRSAPTHPQERCLAPHPSLKPQAFMRQLVRAVLPLGEGVILDPFAGAGSTLAAAEAVGYASVGVEVDEVYYQMAVSAIPALAKLQVRSG